jgi:hypothetical protein
MLFTGSATRRRIQTHPTQELVMNAFSISIVAIVLTAALAAVAPVSHYAQHEIAALRAHEANTRALVQPGAGSGLQA